MYACVSVHLQIFIYIHAYSDMDKQDILQNSTPQTWLCKTVKQKKLRVA